MKFLHSHGLFDQEVQLCLEMYKQNVPFEQILNLLRYEMSIQKSLYEVYCIIVEMM